MAQYEIRRDLTSKWLIVYSHVFNHYGVKKIRAWINTNKRDALKIAAKLEMQERRGPLNRKEERKWKRLTSTRLFIRQKPMNFSRLAANAVPMAAGIAIGAKCITTERGRPTVAQTQSSQMPVDWEALKPFLPPMDNYTYGKRTEWRLAKEAVSDARDTE